MKKLLLILALMGSVLAMPALARQAPMEAANRVSFVKVEGQEASVERTRNAIFQSAQQLGWNVVGNEPGKVLLQLNKSSGKHVVNIAVNYDANGFQLDYIDSVNMNYELENGTAYIHPNYNRWLFNLGRNISNQQMQIK